MKYLALVLACLCLGCGAVSGPSHTAGQNEFLWEVNVAACPSQASAPKASPNVRPLSPNVRPPVFSEDSPWYGSVLFDPKVRPPTFSEVSQRYGCAWAHRAFGSIEPGSTEQLAAIAYPDGHADDLGRRLHGLDVTWRSLNTSIATVDSDGLVTAVNPGEGLISVKCNICPLPSGVGFGYGLAEYLGPHSPASSQAR